jgi:hypothetical protein
MEFRHYSCFAFSGLLSRIVGDAGRRAEAAPFQRTIYETPSSVVSQKFVH